MTDSEILAVRDGITDPSPTDFDGNAIRFARAMLAAAAPVPGEPRFLLLGRDPSFAALVNMWASIRRLDRESDPTTIAEAERLANEGVEWAQALSLGGFQPHGMLKLTRALCVLAELVGAVVTIEQEPLQPLAMGHYGHRSHVRFKREGPA